MLRFVPVILRVDNPVRCLSADHVCCHLFFLQFTVASASTLPVYQPHPEDLELDNEPTLFEQVMNAADSSDSEGEDPDLDQEAAEKKVEESKKDK